MKNLHTIILLTIFFLLECKEEPVKNIELHPVQEQEQRIYREVNELNYIPGVTLSDLLKVINENGFTLYEENKPVELKLEDKIIVEHWFTNFYRKDVGQFEINIRILGLGDKVGVVGVGVKHHHTKPNGKRVRRLFNRIVSKLPNALFVDKIKYRNFTKILTEQTEHLYSDTLGGIEYKYSDYSKNIDLDIAGEGN